MVTNLHKANATALLETLENWKYAEETDNTFMYILMHAQ